jgi:3'-phosphoadenosine 5'-phosphosulfate sulfotransferase (PAPS reductase)/FAD synthetase
MSKHLQSHIRFEAFDLRHFRLPLPASINFSGGRTSAFLLYQVLQAFGGVLPDSVKVTFANTGKEREETLAFVHECGERWGVPIVWLEYWRDESKPLVVTRGAQPNIGQHAYRIVDFFSASRRGEPFEAVIQTKADFRRKAKNEPPILPNPTDRWCSAELKQRTIHRYLRDQGWETYTTAVGLRVEEPRRVAALKAQSTQAVDYACPLYDAEVDEAQVLQFWSGQPFDLQLRVDPELGTYEGNCDLCFLKRPAKVARLIAERPDMLGWWAEMEEKTAQTWFRNRPSYSAIRDGLVDLRVLDASDCGIEETTCLCTD